jgi:predicted oxidoreductase
VSRLAYGCWRLAPHWQPGQPKADALAAGRRAILAAFDAGFTFFDHADIYCNGLSEEIFGDVLREVPGMRSSVVIATKCGIRKPDDPRPGAPYRYDFSARHIIWSCEQSLQRMGVDTIDLYQLHRADYLADPAEVAGAFVSLLDAGKVRAFGVSNFRPSQLSLLQRACPLPLVAHQFEVSLAQLASLENGTLDQCLTDGILPMAWSPLAAGQLADGASHLLPSQTGYRIPPIVEAMDRVAAERGARRSQIALAWLLRHPSRIVPIVGSTDSERIRQAAEADNLELDRETWYGLLTAGQGQRLP